MDSEGTREAMMVALHLMELLEKIFGFTIGKTEKEPDQSTAVFADRQSRWESLKQFPAQSNFEGKICLLFVSVFTSSRHFVPKYGVRRGTELS